MIMLVYMGAADAAMMGGTGGVSGSMMGGGMMGLTNSGGFGMMNGMAGAPVVGDDGTAYIVGFNSTAPANTLPEQQCLSINSIRSDTCRPDRDADAKWDRVKTGNLRKLSGRYRLTS